MDERRKRVDFKEIFRRDIRERRYEPGDLEDVQRGFEPFTDDGQFAFADGAGNKTYFMDTSGGDVTLTLPSAGPSAGIEYKVKRTTAGVNALTITALSGNIDGTASIGVSVQYDCLQIVSDGSNWWIV